MLTKQNVIKIIIKNSLKALIAISIAGIFIYLVSARITKISQSISETKSLFTALSRRSETLFKLRKDLENADAVQQKLADALIPSNNILNFVTALENLAAQNGIQQINNFEIPSPLPPEENGDILAVINYKINLSGTVTSLIAYLKNFEQLPFITSISSLSLTASQPGGWENASNIQLNAKLYTRWSE